MPPHSAALPAHETGVRFVLNDATFFQWFSAAITPEDQADFVHIHGGTNDHARLICAMDYLKHADTTLLGTHDLIVRAYCITHSLPIPASERDPVVQAAAHDLYRSDACQTLLARVQYRSYAEAMERVAKRTVAKVEELHERASTIEDEGVKLRTERVALEYGVRLIANASLERRSEQTRRDRRSIVQAMNDSLQRTRKLEGDVSPQEAKLLVQMLKESLEPADFQAVLEHAQLPELQPAPPDEPA